VILSVSGLFDCYQLAASAAFVSSTRPASAARAFGIAQGGLSLGQGAAIILAGGAAQYYPPGDMIAVGGLLGVVATALITVSSRRTRPGLIPGARPRTPRAAGRRPPG
jgi:hypothetical protein